MPLLPTLTLLLFGAADAQSAPQVDPTPRPVLKTVVARWDFEQTDEGWVAQNDCTLSSKDGLLRIESSGNDPFFHRPVTLPGGEVALKIVYRTKTASACRVYWTTDKSPARGESKVRGAGLTRDGRWHDCVIRFSAPGTITNLRIDPGHERGACEIDSIELLSFEPHPLTIEKVQGDEKAVRFFVKNHRTSPLACTALGRSLSIGPGQTVRLSCPLHRKTPLESVTLDLASKDLPEISRTVFVYHADVEAKWTRYPLGEYSLEVAPEASLARVWREKQLVAILGPLVQVDGRAVELSPAAGHVPLRFEGDGVRLSFSTVGSEIHVSIRSDKPCEGPVVRAFGDLEQGLLAGVEHLGRGERSSSKLDIETAEHLRFAPDLLDVTMPLMACVTDQATVAITWDDMALQPVFATPNFVDVAADHRMALRGKKIDAIIRFDKPQPIEETILWAVKRKGLPPLPKPPRTADQQWALCTKALNGPLKTEKGWGHCLQDRWPRHPYADIISTIWRLTGELPSTPNFVPNGSHVRNPAAWFVTGRAESWLHLKRGQIDSILRRQKEDGSFRYDGKMRRGHFENTASGVCALPAKDLLEFARFTGDKRALNAGLRALEYMKRFRTPRGAQVWEVPLHTPDILASANLVWAYVRGYELTGNKEYLAEARRWALSGIPFVYQWGDRPIMLYATTPVLGATHWRHNWIGLPVQWCGGVYAYALTLLAPYDDTLDWNQLARGILISAEQQQYPDGEKIGLLPDSFHLGRQQRLPADINPCALVSLRMALDGRLDGLSVVAKGNHRVVAPFPVTIEDGKARIQAKKGVRYQVLIDGQRFVDITSQGTDVVTLEGK